MSSHDVTAAGYLACVLLGLCLQVASTRPGARIPSIGALLGWIMRTRSGRVGVTAGWMWLGLHYFAR
jgi:hypothetical protein